MHKNKERKEGGKKDILKGRIEGRKKKRNI
jgi:hypothetical protein